MSKTSSEDFLLILCKRLSSFFIRFTFKLASTSLILLSIWIFAYRWMDPPGTFLMHLRKTEAFKAKKNFELKHKKINYEALPLDLIFSVVYAEDTTYFEHNGLILDNLKLGLKSFLNRDENKKLKGYSTITQQTAKNLFLYPNRTLFRKTLEIPIVVMMELLFSKKRILELYLNYIEWGNGIFGIESAANYYFNKSAKNLTPQESALLAVIIYNPRNLNPLNLPEKDLYRASIIYEMTRRKLFLDKISKGKN